MVHNDVKLALHVPLCKKKLCSNNCFCVVV